MKSIKGLSFYNSEGSLIDVEELYAQVQQLKQDSAAKIIIGETASTTSTTSSDIDELAGTETDISLTNADDFKAGDMGISIVTVTDRNNSHGFMVFLALADEPDQPAGTLHVRFVTGIYNGKDGIDGVSATIEVGTVTTGAAGSQASVTNSGTENAAVLDFTIPQGADGASGVTDVTAGTPTEQDGYTVTPVTFNFEQGNSKTVNIQAKNGDGAGVQQNAIINRTASVSTADENSPDFVIKEGNLYVKAEGKLGTYAFTYINKSGTVQQGALKGAAATTSAVYIFGNLWSGNRSNYICKYDPETNSISRLSTTIPTTLADMGIASIGDVIYLFGGSTGTGNENGGDATNTIYKFDAQTETITALTATLPTSCWGCSAAYSPSNNKIYVFGGNTPIDPLNTILEFDPTTETINSVGTFDLSYSDGGIFHAPAVTIGTKIYLFAGQGKSYTRYSSVWIFDTVSKTTPQRTQSILPRVFEYYFGAATLNNGLVYLFNKEEDADTPVYVFNPSTQQVYSTTSLCPLEHPTACTYKESIIVVGNKDYTPDYNIRKFAEKEGLRYFRIPVQDSLGVISAGGFNATT